MKLSPLASLYFNEIRKICIFCSQNPEVHHSYIHKCIYLIFILKSADFLLILDKLEVIFLITISCDGNTDNEELIVGESF